ncbi:MAG: Gfo/Idh/MocA family oxidoreductase [Planctomycetaceae bacterium]|nr:Gfo/Idh/MocA family oxidoreductase [Planctomycetaceae bacterium]
MSKIRFGILSTAKIGTAKVIPAMQQGEFTEVTAISSRNLEKAQAAASELGIQNAFGSYEELLADPEIDAVYNPLPNDMHVEWSIKALEAGKHVLCEKPIGLSAAEGQKLVAAAAQHPELKVMEAFMYRHHPQWQKTKELVDSEAIGPLRTIQSHFAYFNRNADDIRNKVEAGGGALMDIGCYNISLSRFLFGAEPQRVFGRVERDPDFGTDKMTSGMLEFSGGTSTFTCSTQMFLSQRVIVFGTEGRIEIEIPFNAPPDRPTKMWLTNADGTEEIIFDICDQYTIQGDLFAQAILNDTDVPTPLIDAVQNMKVIEAIFASGESQQWESLG